jgi:hypothetical protein
MTQVRALERSMRELKKAAGEDRLFPTLLDSIKVTKDTLRLMMVDSAA